MNGQKIKEAYSDGSYLTFTYDVYGNNVKKSAFDANGNEINSTEYVYEIYLLRRLMQRVNHLTVQLKMQSSNMCIT